MNRSANPVADTRPQRGECAPAPTALLATQQSASTGAQPAAFFRLQQSAGNARVGQWMTSAAADSAPAVVQRNPTPAPSWLGAPPGVDPASWAYLEVASQQWAARTIAESDPREAQFWRAFLDDLPGALLDQWPTVLASLVLVGILAVSPPTVAIATAAILLAAGYVAAYHRRDEEFREDHAGQAPSSTEKWGLARLAGQDLVTLGLTRAHEGHTGKRATGGQLSPEQGGHQAAEVVAGLGVAGLSTLFGLGLQVVRAARVGGPRQWNPRWERPANDNATPQPATTTSGVPVDDWAPVSRPSVGAAPTELTSPTAAAAEVASPLVVRPGSVRPGNDNDGLDPEPLAQVYAFAKPAEELPTEVPLICAANGEAFTGAPPITASTGSDGPGDPGGSGGPGGGGRKPPAGGSDPPGAQPTRGPGRPSLESSLDIQLVELRWQEYFLLARARPEAKFGSVSVLVDGYRMALTDFLSRFEAKVLAQSEPFGVEQAVALTGLAFPGSDPARPALIQAVADHLHLLVGQKDLDELPAGQFQVPLDELVESVPLTDEVDPAVASDRSPEPDLADRFDLSGFTEDDLDIDQAALATALRKDLLARPVVDPSRRTSWPFTVTASGRRDRGSSGHTVDTIEVIIKPDSRAPGAPAGAAMTVFYDSDGCLNIADLGGPAIAAPASPAAPTWPSSEILAAVWEQVERLADHQGQAQLTPPTEVSLDISHQQWRQIAGQVLNRSILEILHNLPEYLAVVDWAHSHWLTAQITDYRLIRDDQEANLVVTVGLTPDDARPGGSGPADSGPAGSGLTGSGPAGSGLAGSGPARSGLADSRPASSGPDRAGPAGLKLVRADSATFSPVDSDPASGRTADSGPVPLWDVHAQHLWADYLRLLGLEVTGSPGRLAVIDVDQVTPLDELINGIDFALDDLTQPYTVVQARLRVREHLEELGFPAATDEVAAEAALSTAIDGHLHRLITNEGVLEVAKGVYQTNPSLLEHDLPPASTRRPISRDTPVMDDESPGPQYLDPGLQDALWNLHVRIIRQAGQVQVLPQRPMPGVPPLLRPLPLPEFMALVLAALRDELPGGSFSREDLLRIGLFPTQDTMLAFLGYYLYEGMILAMDRNRYLFNHH